MSAVRSGVFALSMIMTIVLAVGSAGPVGAQVKPEGEIKYALYVTIAPQWFA